jgi:hypothetical protein
LAKKPTSGVAAVRNINAAESKVTGLLVYLAIYLVYAILLVIAGAGLYLLYQGGYISEPNFEFIFTTIFQLSFTIVVIAYLILYKKYSIRESIRSLGMGRDRLSASMFGIGILLFVIIFALEIIASLASAASGVSLPTNVGSVLGSAPLWFLIFSAVLEPINEEILFRGFLVPRIGIVASAAVFAMGHIGYNSIIEVVAAFAFGLVAGYTYKKTGSLYPSIIAHILVNSLAVAALLGVL